MKTLVIACVVAFSAHTLHGTPSPTPTPFDITQVDTSKISADEIAKTIAHRNQLFQEQQQQNAQTDTEIKTQAQTLVDAAQASDQSAKALAAYQESVATIVDKANKSIAQLDALVKKHHLDLLILIGLWTGFVVLLYMKAGSMLGPVGIYAAGALELAGSAFILWRL